MHSLNALLAASMQSINVMLTVIINTNNNLLIASLVIKNASIKLINIIIIVSTNVVVKVIVTTNMKINFLIASQAINTASIKLISTMNTVSTIVPVTPLLIPPLPALKP
jgi:hypothetical protein